MSEGWFALHRGWRDNQIFRGEYSRADAWVWLIENAAWKPARTRIKGDTIDLARGELSFAQRFLAEKWGWSKSRVDRFIAELREEGMIETRSKNGATADHAAGQGQCIITICNYAKYQDVGTQGRGNDDAPSGATAGQQRGKEEQGNKETIVEEETSVSPSKARAHKSAAEPKVRMTSDWKPSPLPETVRELTDQWPPGRLEREAEQFRDYWLDRTDRRPGWDRSFHNRIRDIHDRVMRDNHGRHPRNISVSPPPGNRGTRPNPCLDMLRFSQTPDTEGYPGDDESAWPPLRAIGSG